jgi:hypothetical protein
VALTNAYVLPIKRIPDVFAKIRDGQAPDQFSTQLLKDWDFKSTNDRAFIPLLKALGFLTSEGKPTQRYNNYRDHSQSSVIMAEALKEAYGDMFLIKAKPTATDKRAIEGKFKSFHNASDNVADLMAKTFIALLELADFNGEHLAQPKVKSADLETNTNQKDVENIQAKSNKLAGLHYNIQIHLPATKDVEVYNAIFKSLRGHLLEE